jgi:hypothetical protein
MASVRSQKMLNSLPQDTIWAKLNWLLTTYPDGIDRHPVPPYATPEIGWTAVIVLETPGKHKQTRAARGKAGC